MNPLKPPAALREELEGLQREASVLRQDLSRLTNESRQAQANAMAAVQAGDDAAARAALQHQQRCVDNAALVATELEMLELMVSGYGNVLAAIDLTAREPGRLGELAERTRLVKPLPPRKPLPPSNEEL